MRRTTVILGLGVSPRSVPRAAELPTARRAVHNPLVAGHDLNRDHVQLRNSLMVRHAALVHQLLQSGSVGRTRIGGDGWPGILNL